MRWGTKMDKYEVIRYEVCSGAQLAVITSANLILIIVVIMITNIISVQRTLGHECIIGQLASCQPTSIVPHISAPCNQQISYFTPSIKYSKINKVKRIKMSC